MHRPGCGAPRLRAGTRLGDRDGLRISTTSPRVKPSPAWTSTPLLSRPSKATSLVVCASAIIPTMGQRLADPVRHGRVGELLQPFRPVGARDPVPQRRAGGDIRSHCFDDLS
ncbi:hypothetical protein S40285_09862 [Stachybotrys chlorohalonatus IBT 40285]|uniref:Uncharacterized protein n=1 Tax=Stachybotrys chlorohalonatus (strain IBT 40285) TaxID=1283841 RepID=A0A084QJU5_STAC4|nr:hypothetical protein S40285_09862 [Stachybotrys chlorohalonata IBT 40285]